jgi:hypothetical protein
MEVEMRRQFFWDVTLRHWVFGFLRFERANALRPLKKTLEDETTRLSGNVENHIDRDVASHPRTNDTITVFFFLLPNLFSTAFVKGVELHTAFYQVEI